MEDIKPKKKNKKKVIIISLVSIITIFVIGILIYNSSLGYKLKVDYLLSYKKSHTSEETHQKIDNMFDINTKENDEVYNIVFADEIQATKKALAQADKQKKKEEESKQNDANNVKLLGLKQIPNSNEIEFTIDNKTQRKIGYIEMTIDFLDGTGNVITSDWTNESNIPGGTKRLKQTYVNPPNGTKKFNVTISEVDFVN